MSRIKTAFDSELKNRIENTDIKNIIKQTKSVSIPMILLNNTFGIKGILIENPYAKWMWMGKKSHIILSNDLSHMANKALYLCDKENSFGVIRIHYPNKITHEQLVQRKEFNLVTEDDIESLKGKDLYEYSYDWISKFDSITPWKFSESTQDEYGFIENIQFIFEQKESRKEKEYSNSIDAIVIDKSFDSNGKEIYHLGLPCDNAELGRIVNALGGKFFFIGRARKYDVKVPVGAMVKVLFDKAVRCKLCDRIEIQKPCIKESSYEEKPSSYNTIFKMVENEKTNSIEISHKPILSTSLPSRMKRNLTKIMESKAWMPYAMHFHSEGKNIGVHVGLFVPSEDYGKVLTYLDAEEMCENNNLKGIIEGFSLAVNEGVGIDFNEGKLNNPESPHPIFADGKFGEAVCTPLSHGIYAVNNVSGNHIEIKFNPDKNICMNQVSMDAVKKAIPFNGNINLSDEHIIKLRSNGRLSMEKKKGQGSDSSVTPSQMHKIYILRDSMSIREMSNEIGLSGKTIYNHMKKMGIN